MRQGEFYHFKKDGMEFYGQFLGKGFYCTAIREALQRGDYTGRVILLPSSREFHDKDYLITGHNCGCESMKHIPFLEREEIFDKEGGITDGHYYVTRYYAPLRASNREAWKIFVALKKEYDAVREQYFQDKTKERSLYGRDYPGYYISMRFMDAIQKRADIPESIKEALQEVFDAGLNYGADWTPEFRSANMGIGEEGELIFRDLLFSVEDVHGYWKAKIERMRGY